MYRSHFCHAVGTFHHNGFTLLMAVGGGLCILQTINSPKEA